LAAGEGALDGLTYGYALRPESASFSGIVGIRLRSAGGTARPLHLVDLAIERCSQFFRVDRPHQYRYIVQANGNFGAVGGGSDSPGVQIDDAATQAHVQALRLEELISDQIFRITITLFTGSISRTLCSNRIIGRTKVTVAAELLEIDLIQRHAEQLVLDARRVP
jgi:hypothetical protein